MSGAVVEDDFLSKPRNGQEQVSGRDGGVGVNESALQDGIDHPLGPPTFRPDQYGGTYTYIGKTQE
jgi:hypothetical protein